jgi:hypothetical protein
MNGETATNGVKAQGKPAPDIETQLDGAITGGIDTPPPYAGAQNGGTIVGSGNAYGQSPTAIPDASNAGIQNNPTSAPGASNPNTKGQTAKPFRGFILTVYAADGSGETPTANSMSEMSPVIMQPDVIVPIGSYSPLMSSVPGLPFSFDAEYEYDIHVSVNAGTLLSWDIQAGSGPVTDLGNETVCSNRDTLFWSPMTDTGSAKTTTITVSAVENGKVIGTQDIYITSDEFGYYFAQVGNLETR